jgi:hypothetical protein
MPSTITRQKLVDAVKARMATILIANGFYTDIGKNVMEWRTAPIGDEDLGSCSVSDPEDVPIQESIKGGGTVQDRWLTVVISLPFAGGSSTSGATMRQAVADVYKAIGAVTPGFNLESWGGLAMLTEDMGNTQVVRQEEHRLIGVDITIRIMYRTAKWQES